MPPKRISYKIYTLGCKVNQYDSGSLDSWLRSSGAVCVEKNADLALVNTCAVTEAAQRKAARTLNLAKKEHPAAKLAVIGCAGELEEKNRPWTAMADLVWGTGDKEELVAEIFRLFFAAGVKKTGIDYGNRVKNNRRSRYTIKIQDGCEQFCTYCIVPYTRKKLKSRPESEIIMEVKAAIKAKVGEIVLSGIHLGLYGKDRQPESPPGLPLVELIEALIKLPGLGRIRLSSIEINEITDELLELVKGGKVCPHLHIPLQAGSDKILERMNRPYSLDKFRNRIKEIRKQIPDIAITTDIITGFPGETEKDFAETFEAVKEINFSRLHVFPFSKNALAPAAKFAGQVPEKTRLERAKKLRALGQKLAKDYRAKFKGRELEVIVEKADKNGLLGKTGYYFDIWFDAGDLTGNSAKIEIGCLAVVKYQ